MIAVIGGIETTVNIKMMPQKPEGFGEEDNDQQSPAVERTVGGHDASGFESYMRRQRRAMEAEEYWSKVGSSGSGVFGATSAFVEEDSNIDVRINGCGYNVAKIIGENSQKGLCDNAAFISMVGSDALGFAAVNALNMAGVNTDGIDMAGGATAVRVEVRNMMGDLEFLRKNDAVLKGITPEFVESKKAILDEAAAIFLDGSLSPETISYVVDNYSDKKIYFDPASVKNAVKYQEGQWKFDCVMPGRRESEAMTCLTVLGLDQLMAAGKCFEDKGIERTVITLKGGGLYYKEGIDEGLIKPERVLSFAQTSGAGDVVSASIVMGLMNGKSLKEAGEAAIAAAGEYLSAIDDDSVFTQLKKEGKY